MRTHSVRRIPTVRQRKKIRQAKRERTKFGYNLALRLYLLTNVDLPPEFRALLANSLVLSIECSYVRNSLSPRVERIDFRRLDWVIRSTWTQLRIESDSGVRWLVLVLAKCMSFNWPYRLNKALSPHEVANNILANLEKNDRGFEEREESWEYLEYFMDELEGVGFGPESRDRIVALGSAELGEKQCHQKGHSEKLLSHMLGCLQLCVSQQNFHCLTDNEHAMRLLFSLQNSNAENLVSNADTTLVCLLTEINRVEDRLAIIDRYGDSLKKAMRMMNLTDLEMLLDSGMKEWAEIVADNDTVVMLHSKARRRTRHGYKILAACRIILKLLDTLVAHRSPLVQRVLGHGVLQTAAMKLGMCYDYIVENEHISSIRRVLQLHPQLSSAVREATVGGRGNNPVTRIFGAVIPQRPTRSADYVFIDEESDL